LPPRSRGGRSADRRPGAAAPGWPAITLQAGHPAGCPASLAIGTRASRRSTLAIFGFGSALPASAFPPKHVQRAPRSTGHSARRAVSEPLEPAVTSRSRETPTLAPPSGPSPETPFMSEDKWPYS
jgi:hypothetical protein